MSEETKNDNWSDDRFARKDDAEFLISFLVRKMRERAVQGRTRSFVLNLDAPWGQGKSFFLDRLARDLRIDGLLVAEVNAWEDDHADDPLLSVMSAINKAVKPHFARKNKAQVLWRSFKSNAASLSVPLGKGRPSSCRGD